MDLFSNLELDNKEKNITNYELPNADIKLIESFLSPNESNKAMDSLINTVQWQQDYIKMYGKQIPLPRLTAWYGDSGREYSYSGIPMKPHPWNDELLKIKNLIEAECDSKFSSVLLNLYRDGSDSVSWHQDDEKELGQNPTIASLSLGETRKIQLKHIHDENLKQALNLTNGSLLVMKGETQHFWKHQIPKTKKKIGQRLNLTFRLIK